MSGTNEGRPARGRPQRDGGEKMEQTATATAPKPSWDAIEKARAIVLAALDLKAEQIVVLDMREVSSFADVFVIATGRSDRHVRSIAESIAQRLAVLGDAPLGMEGQQEGRWVLIDANDVIVHVFDPETREAYDLERLWSDAPALALVPEQAEQAPS